MRVPIMWLIIFVAAVVVVLAFIYRLLGLIMG